MIEDIQ